MKDIYMLNTCMRKNNRNKVSKNIINVFLL